ncbi:MAG: DUF2062 domain-containing protein [Nitrospirae bacterium]|nr:DUF2062 domain-containing protein [Nitrospirota bacterium]
MIPLTIIREKLHQILHLGDSPQRTALAFAVGVLIAFSPTYGLHTASAFLFAWAFRLNFLALMAGNLINNPWTFLPIVAGSMWVGLLLDPAGAPPAIAWNDFTLRMLWDQFHPYVVPFVLGHVLLGIVGAAAGYVIMYQAILKFREHHAKTHQQAPVAPPPPSC